MQAACAAASARPSPLTLAAELARHHLFATRVLFLEQLAGHRLAREFGGNARHVPAAREQAGLGPPFRVVADIVVADLFDLGGVFGDEAVRLDEIREHIAARAVTA